MHTPSAQSVPQLVGRDDPARPVVLQVASAPVLEAFGDRVRVRVERIVRMREWVFVQGRMRGPDGGRPDYSGTDYAQPAARGQMSDRYVALLNHTGGPDDDWRTWRLTTHRIGPTDVAWDAWPVEHGAPRALFSL
jgi:hypothetical protein